MTATAIALVLTSAFVHAAWNLLAKRLSGYDEFAYLWILGLCSAVLYAPPVLVVILVSRPHLGPAEAGFILGSAVLHIAYFVLLQRGYRVGDLSLIYPLARGTGPMLSSAFAIVFLAERPGLAGIGGILAVGLGVFVLGMPGRGESRPSAAAVGFGLATGLLIATYTVWDKHAVATLAIHPLLYQWGEKFSLTIMITPTVASAKRRAEIRELWTRHRRYLLIAGVLMPMSYLLVLIALVFSPVSAIAPAREVSVLIAVILGGRLLAEGHLRRRLPAAATIAAGVIAITLA